jgi:hypothetical protein
MNREFREEPIPRHAAPAQMMVGVWPHMLYLLFALPGVYGLFLLASREGNPASGIDLLFWIIIAGSVFHQWMVWLVWRVQLCFNLMRRLFGRYDLLVWGGMFLPFLVLRIAGTVVLAALDPGSLSDILPVASTLRIGLGIALLMPAAYGIYSVLRYFDLVRALGGDHFRAYYQQLASGNPGAFRYSGNVMYGLVFLILWAAALLFRFAHGPGSQRLPAQLYLGSLLLHPSSPTWVLSTDPGCAPAAGTGHPLDHRPQNGYTSRTNCL